VHAVLVVPANELLPLEHFRAFEKCAPGLVIDRVRSAYGYTAGLPDQDCVSVYALKLFHHRLSGFALQSLIPLGGKGHRSLGGRAFARAGGLWWLRGRGGWRVRKA